MKYGSISWGIVKEKYFTDSAEVLLEMGTLETRKSYWEKKQNR